MKALHPALRMLALGAIAPLLTVPPLANAAPPQASASTN